MIYNPEEPIIQTETAVNLPPNLEKIEQF